VRPYSVGKKSIVNKNLPIPVYHEYAGVGFFIALCAEELGVFGKENLTVKNRIPK